MQPLEETSLEERSEEKEVVDKVLSRTRPSRAIVKRMELALILQEGAAPELIENIRQLTMAASKFDRDRGDKLTIMTASFKERRDQRSAEQIMLKNIAEKIDDLEQRRASESSNFREDIETYKEEITQRREEDLKLLETQLEDIDKKRLQEAAEYEKKELARKDSIRNLVSTENITVLANGSLFNNKLEILIHPASLVHAIIEFRNGLVKFMYHDTSMIIPIANAIFDGKLNIKEFYKTDKKNDKLENLVFKKVDKKIFPVIILKNRLNEYPSTSIIINAANEILVELFLNKKIPFLSISKTILKILNDRNYKKYAIRKPKNIHEITKIDKWARENIKKILNQND